MICKTSYHSESPFFIFLHMVNMTDLAVGKNSCIFIQFCMHILYMYMGSILRRKDTEYNEPSTGGKPRSNLFARRPEGN